MRHINVSNGLRRELEEVGVALLSGESCNLGMRVTTDISPAAAPLVEEFLAVKLHQSGMNGWARQIAPGKLGRWQSGRMRAWDYDLRTKRDGWETADGFCIHLPRSLVTDLFVFLTLKAGQYEVIIHSWPVQQPYGGLRFDESLLLFEPGEHERFMETFFRLYEIYKAGDYPDNSVEYTAKANYLAKWSVEEVIAWRRYFAHYATTNTHAWSGRQLV